MCVQETVVVLISIHPPETVVGVEEEDKIELVHISDNKPIDFSLGSNLDGIPMVMKKSDNINFMNVFAECLSARQLIVQCSHGMYILCL